MESNDFKCEKIENIQYTTLSGYTLWMDNFIYSDGI